MTNIWGHIDVDTIQFGDATGVAGGTPRSPATSSSAPRRPSTAATLDSTGRRRGPFIVNQLQTMDVAGGHTLTLDGQADTDDYAVNTTGQRVGSSRNYVINVSTPAPRRRRRRARDLRRDVTGRPSTPTTSSCCARSQSIPERDGRPRPPSWPCCTAASSERRSTPAQATARRRARRRPAHQLRRARSTAGCRSTASAATTTSPPTTPARSPRSTAAPATTRSRSASSSGSTRDAARRA